MGAANVDLPPGFVPDAGDEQPPGFTPEPAPIQATEVDLDAYRGPKRLTDVARSPEEEAELEKDATIFSMLKEAYKGNPERDASVIRIADETHTRANIIDLRHEEIKAAWEASKEDPRAFRTSRPDLTELLLAQPEYGSVALLDKPLSMLERLKKWLDVPAELPSVANAPPMTRESLAAAGARSTEEKKAAFEAGQKEQAAANAAEAAKPPEKAWMRVDSSAAKADRGHAYVASYMHAAKQTEWADLGFELMRRRNAGLDTFAIEKRLSDLKKEMQPTYFGDSGFVDRMILDATEILPSIVETTKAAGVGGAVAGTVGAAAGGAAGLVTGGPAAAAALAKSVGGTAMSLGARGASAARSFEMITGSAYLDNLQLPGVDHQIANGMAVAEGFVSAGIEAATFGVELKMFGPLGEAVAAGKGRKFLADALKDRTARELIRRIGAAQGKGLGAEVGEEGLQDLVHDLAQYLAKAVASGETPTPDIKGSLLGAAETMAKTASGLGVLATVPGSFQLTQETIRLGQSQKAGQRIATIRGVAKGSPTVKAAPKLVAKLIERQTAGEVTHAYVDTGEFVRYFQAGNADPKEAAKQILGEEGPKKLQEAISTGQRLEIPMDAYLDKMAATDAGEALAPHTTTNQALLTPAGIEAMGADLQAHADAIVKEYEEARAAKEKPGVEGEAPAVPGPLEQMVQDLMARDALTEEDALAAAVPHLAVRRTLAARSGKTVEEMFGEMAVRVETEGQIRPDPIAMSEAAVALHAEGKRKTGTKAVAEEMFLDDVTGGLNVDAFDLVRGTPGSLVGVITTPYQKVPNDSPVGGHPTGNELLRTMGVAVGKNVARSGTNFLVRGTQEEINAATERVRAAMPDQRMSVYSAVGEDRKAAGEALDALVDADRESGKLPKRDKMALGGTLEESDAAVAAIEMAMLAKPEKTSADLTPEMLAKAEATAKDTAAHLAIYRDKVVPGLWNGRGWAALPPKPHVAAVDLKKLREKNERYGKQAGDDFLLQFGHLADQLAREMGVDAGHLSGDEYAFQHTDAATLVSYLARLHDAVQNHVFKSTDKAGKPVEFVKEGFRRGFGKTYGEADRDLNRRKRREQSRVGGEPGGGGPAPHGGGGQPGGDGPSGEGGSPQGGLPGSGLQGSAEVEDDSFPFGANADIQGFRGTVTELPDHLEDPQLDEARAWIGRLRKPEKKQLAQDWFDYCVGILQDEPNVTSDIELKLAEFGVVTRKGFAFDEERKDLREWTWRKKRDPNAKKGGGVMPASLREHLLRRKGKYFAYGDADVGVVGPDGKMRYYQPAFHGSPHRGIDQFSLHRIGTGEGAQAYGWGMYFAGSRSVAEFYRKKLSPRPTITLDGKPISDLTVDELFSRSEPLKSAATRVSQYIQAQRNLGYDDPSASEAIGYVRNQLLEALEANREDLEMNEAPAEHLEAQGLSRRSDKYIETTKRVIASLEAQLQALDGLKGRLVEVSKPGQLYRAEVPDDVELLDYDADLSAQPPGVAERLRASGLLSQAEQTETTVRAAENPRIAAMTPTAHSLLDIVVNAMRSGDDFVAAKKEAVGAASDMIFAFKRRENADELVRDAKDALTAIEALAPEDIVVEKNTTPFAGTGQALYHQLSENLGGPQAASEALRDAGIPGLRYLDQGSRAAGEGSHNYVIWDEARMPITETYYQGEKQTETPAFKKWFGKSKVVDANGEPRRVYHGTGSASFEAFAKEFQDPNALMGPGFYFTEDPEIAGEYVDKAGRLTGERGDTPSVYPAFLSIERPFDVEADAGQLVAQLQKFKAKMPPADVKRMIDSAIREEPENFGAEGIGLWVDNTLWAYELAQKAGLNGAQIVGQYGDYIIAKARDYIVKKIRGREMWSGSDVLKFIEQNVEPRITDQTNAGNIRLVLEKLGFDGITHEGGKLVGTKLHKVWIAFEPGQVKSAIGNRGTFDPNDPSILRQGPRGWMQRIHDNLFKVMLRKNADLSTFLHESGHIFLDMLQDVAARPDAPADVKADLETARAWMGLKPGERIQREHHEKWARAFEAYLYEGKAPSEQLAAAFQRFRLWLRSVYSSLKELVLDEDEMSPDIRGVFDRLVATDEEIARAQRSMGPPTFSTPAEAGMTGEEWQAYLQERERATSRASQAVTRRILQEQKRETERWWREELAALQDQVGHDYDAQPAARAWRQLKNGEMTDQDGEVLQRAVNIRMDRAAVVEMIGPEAAKRFTGILVAKDGEHPDSVAADFGFDTGKAMLDAIAALPDRERFVREQAAELMRVKHPGLMEERDRLREAADTAMHREPGAAHAIREWAKLKQRAGVRPHEAPPVESIRLAAKQLVERRAIGRLRVGDALNAERHAAEKTAAAAARREWNAAYVFKQQQLLNHYLYREMVEAREIRDRLNASLADAQNDKRRSKLGKAHGALLGISDQILEALGLREADERSATATVDQMLEQFGVAGLEPVFSVDALRKLLAAPKSFGELTVSEAREIDRALRQIRKAATDINNVTMEGKRVAAQSVAQAVAMEAGKKLRDMDPPQGSPSAMKWRQTAAATLNGLRAAQLDPEAIIGRLGDTATRFFWDRYIDARNAEDAVARKVLEFFQQRWDALPKEMQQRRYDKVDGLAQALPVPKDVNLAWPYDREFLWMVALNMGNESNMERLLGGYGWEEKQVRDVLNANLSKEEWAFLQGVFDMLDEQLYPEVQRVYREANGLDPEKIEATTFVTPHGAFRGGYFPARYSPVASRLGTQQLESRIDKLYAGSGGRTSVARSFTKGRADHYSDVVLLDWSVVPSHVAEVIHYVAFDQMIRETARVMDRPETVGAVQRHLGEEYRTQMEDWLKTVAGGNAEAVPKAIRVVAGVINAIGSRTVVGALGWNWVNATADLSNPLLAIASGDVKARYVGVSTASVIKHYLRHPIKGLAEYRERSTELSHRAHEGARKLRQQLGEIGGGGRRGRIRRFVDETGFFFQEAADKLTSAIVWEAAYREASARGLKPAEATKFANGKVRGVFPSQDAAEQPSILRNKASLGGLIVMHGFFSKAGNIVDRLLADPLNNLMEAEGVGGKARAALGLAPAVGRVLAVLFVYSVIGELLSARGPDEDEDTLAWLERKMIEGAFMPIPIVGSAVGETVGRWALSGELKMRGGSFRASPVAAGVERLLKAIAKAADEDKDADERVWALLEAIGFGAKVPIVQPIRTGKFITDVIAGESGAEGLLDYGGGVWRGEREGQPLGPVDFVRDRLLP